MRRVAILGEGISTSLRGSEQVAITLHRIQGRSVEIKVILGEIQGDQARSSEIRQDSGTTGRLDEISKISAGDQGEKSRCTTQLPPPR